MQYSDKDERYKTKNITIMYLKRQRGTNDFLCILTVNNFYIDIH